MKLKTGTEVMASVRKQTWFWISNPRVWWSWDYPEACFTGQLVGTKSHLLLAEGQANCCPYKLTLRFSKAVEGVVRMNCLTILNPSEIRVRNTAILDCCNLSEELQYLHEHIYLCSYIVVQTRCTQKYRVVKDAFV